MPGACTGIGLAKLRRRRRSASSICSFHAHQFGRRHFHVFDYFGDNVDRDGRGDFRTYGAFHDGDIDGAIRMIRASAV